MDGVDESEKVCRMQHLWTKLKLILQSGCRGLLGIERQRLEGKDKRTLAARRVEPVG